jgi:hypothetical protein
MVAPKTLPQRPGTTAAQTLKVGRLRDALNESKRVKRQYASDRGKHLVNFLRESAIADMVHLEAAAVEKVEAVGFDVTAYSLALERENSGEAM